MAKTLGLVYKLKTLIVIEYMDYIFNIIQHLVGKVIDLFLRSLQAKISALTRNLFTNILINSNQKRSRANTIIKNIMSNICWVILKEQAIRAASKKLKTKDKKFENIKIQ